MEGENGAAGAENGASGAAEDPKTPAVPESRYYKVEAVERKPAPGTKPDAVFFVIEAPDYKIAWQHARKLTAVGHMYFGGKAWSNDDHDTPMEMIPGVYTVKNVESQQQRVTKVPSIAIDELERVLAETGEKLPPKVQAVIDAMRAKRDPIAEPTTGEPPEGGSETEKAEAGGKSTAKDDKEEGRGGRRAAANA